MPHSDPDTRGLHIGCGAALLNLRVAGAHEGWNPETLLLPDPTDRTLLASVRLTGSATDGSELAPRRSGHGRRPAAGHP